MRSGLDERLVTAAEAFDDDEDDIDEGPDPEALRASFNRSDRVTIRVTEDASHVLDRSGETGAVVDPATLAPQRLDGMYLYPDEAGPGSTGTIPTSGTVRLLSIDFSLRSGAFFVQADCAILASRTEIADSGTAVADASIGEVIARYGTDTTILSGSGSDGASDEATWVRYDFSGAEVNVDVNTAIFVALFRSGTATFSSSSLVYLWCDDDSSLLSRGVTQSGITTVRNLYFARWE